MTERKNICGGVRQCWLLQIIHAFPTKKCLLTAWHQVQTNQGHVASGRREISFKHNSRKWEDSPTSPVNCHFDDDPSRDNPSLALARYHPLSTNAMLFCFYHEACSIRERKILVSGLQNVVTFGACDAQCARLRLFNFLCYFWGHHKPSPLAALSTL